MDLSVVIVNWNVKYLVRHALASVFQHTRGIDFEVFVVDNNSHDNSVEELQREFPHVHFIANTENLGFAKGCNQGIKESTGDFVLLLNPDTEVFDNALGNMVAWMRARPQVGVGGVKLLNPDRTLQESVRRFPRFSSQALILLKLHHVFPHLRPLIRYFAKDFDYTREQSVDQVMGSFFCISRSVINKLGGLDERYFIWFEEVDYCKQVKEAGMQVAYTPEISIIHHGGESFAQVFALKKQRMFNESLRKYMRKHHGFFLWLGVAILSPMSIFLAWLWGNIKK